jgi:hypothetical protein
MDISSISKYYGLKALKVKPNQLLLDPNNPRIILDVNTDRKFTLKDLPSPDVQEYILSVIDKQAHHIADLIRGIRASGFVDKGDDMIVKRIPKLNKYLVIEGNRRTTAIKHLLMHADKLKPAVRTTLATLHVKEFVYRQNREFSEEAVIDILLGTIHINGRLPWGALEKAYYIYKSYLREFRKHARHSQFEYVVDCCREVATFFNLSVREVRQLMIVYRIYEQLQQDGYDVLPHHFSLIEMAVTDRRLSEEYFGLNLSNCRFSSRGVAKFDRLCVRDKRPINNPKDFRAFAKVFKHGTEYEVALIESNEQPIEIVLGRLKDRQGEKEFINQLGEIRAQIKDLKLNGFRGMKGEVEIIREIRELVNERLWRLAKHSK